MAATWKRTPDVEGDQEGQVDGQDTAGGEDAAEEADDELDPLGHPKQAWCVILAEYAAASDWRTIGESVGDTVFEDMGTAHLHAENRNKRDFARNSTGSQVRRMHGRSFARGSLAR